MHSDVLILFPISHMCTFVRKCVILHESLNAGANHSYTIVLPLTSANATFVPTPSTGLFLLSKLFSTRRKFLGHPIDSNFRSLHLRCSYVSISNTKRRMDTFPIVFCNEVHYFWTESHSKLSTEVPTEEALGPFSPNF